MFPISPALMMPWIFKPKKQKPVPYIPTLREVEGITGYLKALKNHEIALESLIQTFNKDQYRLYCEVRETGQKALMLAPCPSKGDE